MTPTPYGFRVVGHRAGERRLIDHAAAFAGYAECDPRSEPHREAYLSFFVFADDFRTLLESERSERGFNGPCGASWFWWDVDRPDDLGTALRDARRLVGAILERYRELDESDVLVFLSGSKGVHVGIPAVWRPEPSIHFNRTARRFCLDRAEAAGVVADPSVYSKTRLFRAPNSTHPKTGLHKRRLSLEELTFLLPQRIVELARNPEPFDVPTGPAQCPKAAEDWNQAQRATQVTAVRYSANAGGCSKLSAFARRFIRDGELDETRREVSTFRVAAELTEVYLAGGIDRLVFALLEEAARESGLTPSEVRHAIDGGLTHARRQREGGAS